MRIAGLVMLLCAAAAADLIVLRNRVVIEGPAPAAGILLREDAKGLARNRPSLFDHLDGLRALADRRILKACLKRLPQAVEAGATKTAWELFERGDAAGMEPAQAKKWAQRLVKLTGNATCSVKVPGEEVLVELLVDRAQKALDAEDEFQTHRGYELLRQALVRAPKNEAARNLLDDIAPTHWRVGDPKKDDIQRIWLDWQIDVLEPGVRAVGRLQPDIQHARAWWKRKLHGAQTDDIVFITPLTDSHIVSLCVRYARITCRALDKMFHTDHPQRLAEDFLPLVIYMYENRDEYIRLGGRATGQPGSLLQFTAGFYIPTENVSRFFWPGGPGAVDSIRHTFVHELTHHWIERRNPRWHARDLAGLGVRAQVPGCWVVEGMATFVEEGLYDIRNYTWSHFNPKANALGVVAALSGKQGALIPWKKMYALTQAQFHDGKSLNPRKPTPPIKKRWAMRPMRTSEMRLFYEQAASTCHFLYWGEGGRYREKLLQYVTDFYTSKPERTGIETAFGMTPEALGAKVEAFARAVVYGGWRPAGE